MRTRNSWAALVAGMLPAAQCLYSGGGLTIITDNQLDGRAPTGGSSILLTQQRTYNTSQNACAELSETLWIPDQATMHETLTHLAYHGAQAGFFSNQLYWIGSHADECCAIDAAGRIYATPQKDCELNLELALPALCSQTPGVSFRARDEDISEKWRVRQVVGGSNGQKSTVMTGYRDAHVWKFRGVRYAKSPARFEYTDAPLLESGEVTALTAGADCVQPIGEVTSGSSEDCLFMNIWTPGIPITASANANNTSKFKRNKKERLRPVMVYLYGGGFTSGSGKNPNTDGGNLASRGDTVVVSLNYRVGNLGFLPFGDGVHRGNYALSDMATALEWVKSYIRDFGGDPDNVTLFGESAGAMGVHAMLASPKGIGKDLFHRAIMQSNPAGYPRDGNWANLLFQDVEGHLSETAKVAKNIGCDEKDALECLRGVDAMKLVSSSLNYNVILRDGVYLTSTELLLNSTVAPYPRRPIPVITGFNRDEAGVLLPSLPLPNDTFASYYRNIVSPSFGGLSPSSLNVTALAPILPAVSPSSTLSQLEILNASIAIATAGEFSCLDNAKAYTAARHGVWHPVYSYVFNRSYSTRGYSKPWCDAPIVNSKTDYDGEYFKCHAGEQMITFGTEARSAYAERDLVDGRDYKFMRLVVDYWTAFARSGDPNPDEAWLKQRGYEETLQEVRRTGKWERVVGKGKGRSRLLQWDGKMVDFVDEALCTAMGWPVDVFEG